MRFNFSKIIFLSLLIACQKAPVDQVDPLVVTEPVVYDSDDPAIWIHPERPEESLILGTDKKENENGAVFVFDLNGKIVKVIEGLDRPNNIDLRQGVVLGEDTLDIAVVTERGKSQIRVIKLPELQFIDGGGIPVFEESSARAVMGVALYKRPSDNAVFAAVSRKENAGEKYLYQYQLLSDSGVVSGELIRKFGEFSGTKEVEAIAVDDEKGFLYYSDEHCCIRKYFADPDKGNEELVVFGQEGFADDREGISIYKQGSGGYLIISDQGANSFRFYSRNEPHDFLASVDVQAMQSDGSEVTNIALSPNYPEGLFVAMSDNKTFEIYDIRDLLKSVDSKLAATK